MIRYFVLMSLTSICFADASIEKDVLALVNSEITLVTKQLNATIDRCKPKHRKIDVSSFADIKIPIDELLPTLIYLHNKARKKCESGVWEQYFYTLSKAKIVYDHYGKKKPDEIDMLDTMHHVAWHQLELKVKFNKLDPEDRMALERIEELQSPFSPLDYIEALRAVKKHEESDL